MELQFLGATGEVTGSCFMLTVAGRRLLIECGLVQGSRSHERHNRDAFPFATDTIDAVVLTHAHLDHSGRIPLLVKRGFSGPVHTHRASLELCELMLADAGFLNEREAQGENRRRGKERKDPVEPLYTRSEALEAIEQFRGHDYDVPVDILPGVSCILRDAGHILGSAIVELTVTEESLTRTVVFSGDLGNPDAPILRNPVRPARADLVVMESTYGDRCHRSWDSTWQEMGEVIGGANSGRGNILIPAFTIGRTQSLLYKFREFYDAWGLADWSIVLDTPMGIEATKIHARYPELYDAPAREIFNEAGNPFNLPNLTTAKTAEESMRLNDISSGLIIIAGSGMCTGGRIKHHLKRHISSEQTHIMIVGFQARGTTGRQLVDGAEQIRLWDQEYKVRANVHTIGGLSAHADQQDLSAWFAAIGGQPRCALVHGEPEAAAALETCLQETAAGRVFRPEYGQKINLAEC